MYSQTQENKIQEAIYFLVKSFRETGRNPKPVVFHSIKVAMLLYYENYDADIIIAALLHDLIEDSAVTYEDIKTQFFPKVANIVRALSFKPKIKDYTQKYMEVFERIKKSGKDAVVVKAADLIDNANYYHLATELYPKLIEKHQAFIKIAEDFIPDTNLLKQLKKVVQNAKQRRMK